MYRVESSPTVAVILRGQICVIMNQSLTFDLVKAHQVNYPIIMERQALLSRDNEMMKL